MDYLRRLLGQSMMPDQEAALADARSYNTTAPTYHLRYGQASDIGKTRNNNQDACMAFATSQNGMHTQFDFGLFIVADGMGGHADGEKASSLCMRVVTEYVTQHAYLPMLTLDTGASPPDLMEVLNNGVLAANLAVTQQMPEGGTTITAILTYDEQAYISQVGDSRAYLIDVDEMEMETLTRDHSLVQRLVELDQLTPEQAAEHPHRNILYRAIGQAEHLELDSKIISLPPNIQLLLCSDGLWTVVPKEHIIDIIVNAPNPQAACDQLIDTANSYGGPDNITAILVELPNRSETADTLV